MKVDLEGLAAALDQLAKSKHIGAYMCGVASLGAQAARELDALEKAEKKPKHNFDRFPENPSAAMLEFCRVRGLSAIRLDDALDLVAWLFAPVKELTHA